MDTRQETAANAFQQKISRYLRYNEERKAKAMLFDAGQGLLLLKVLPYLLHCNYPDLPGFVDDADCPYGLHRYNPKTEFPQELFRRYFPNSTAIRADSPSSFTKKPCIHSLKTIGSIGTIAQSIISDCDYWVSIRKEELGEKGLSLLQKKCRIIEDWALKRGSEVHFFLVDIDQTKENNFESETSENSAGSAIKLLLKDELFRTHILVAGKMLLWWFIPPGLSENEYRNFVQNLVAHNRLCLHDFIDLGYLSDIPKAEIFGACLWQINKALDSPFKSVIKLAYLELLLRGETTTLPLFSNRIKCLVTYPEKLSAAEQSAMALAKIDPYILLARDIIAFYTQDRAGQKWAPLIRECLFLKTLEGVASQKNTRPGHDNHLKATMGMMQAWHLLPENFTHFLHFRDWKYKELVAFGAKVHDYLIETYKRLRWIFKSFSADTGLTITERDISILGRKLFTFYEQKDHKIDYIRSVSRDLMEQENLTIHITRHEGSFNYYAFQGQLDHDSMKSHIGSMIKREDNLIRLIVWLLVNGILSAKTQIHLTKNFVPIDLADIQKLTELLIKTFPIIHFSRISPANLLKRETVLRALVIVNFKKEPVKGAKTLKSIIVTENSYGEYFIQEYTTVIQLKNAMRTLLTQHYVSRWNNNLEIFIPAQDEQSYIKTLIEG
ncbi:MAG: adenylate cyclase [Deltaproteobacteria bacterium RIFOXYD12_FULL_55_16]|nr:MAG: adenylate cyclase [Deltaproteobacteria bacterium RIFOXYD12_FULL_55_16]